MQFWCLSSQAYALSARKGRHKKDAVSSHGKEKDTALETRLKFLGVENNRLGTNGFGLKCGTRSLGDLGGRGPEVNASATLLAWLSSCGLEVGWKRGSPHAAFSCCSDGGGDKGLHPINTTISSCYQLKAR